MIHLDSIYNITEDISAVEVRALADLAASSVHYLRATHNLAEMYRVSGDVFGGPVRTDHDAVAYLTRAKPINHNTVADYKCRPSNWEVCRKRLNATLIR